MPTEVRDDHQVSEVIAPLFSEIEHKVHTASGQPDKTQGWWKVKVYARGYKALRDVSYKSDSGDSWETENEGWPPDKVIWPAWPARLEDQPPAAESPLADAQDYWAKVGSRLRDSAKWMATVLGAALAAARNWVSSL